MGRNTKVRLNHRQLEVAELRLREPSLAARSLQPKGKDIDWQCTNDQLAPYKNPVDSIALKVQNNEC
jgi:hypothetical protein